MPEIELDGPRDLQPGDFILAIAFSGRWFNWEHHKLVIGEVRHTRKWFMEYCAGSRFRVMRTHSHAIADAKSAQSLYPHKCPRCAGPAYIGFSSVDCKKGCV